MALTRADVRLIIPRVGRAIASSLLVGVLIMPTLTDAAIFGWHDAQGVAHYVSDPENVPAEYRAEVVTVVKDIPLPPLPAAESEKRPTRADQAASPIASQAPDRMIEASYELGYRAGLAEVAGAPQDASFTSIVQNVQVVESPQPSYVYPYTPSLFGPILGGPSRLHPHRAFSPTNRSRFIQGPAGPPPLGAPGPPPVSFPRPSNRGWSR